MKKDILRIYRKMILTGFLYQILTAIFSLLCACILSEMLSMALAESVQGEVFANYAAYIALSGVALGLLYLFHAKIQQESLWRYRAFVCGGVVGGTIDIGSVGEMDVRLGKDADTICNYYGSSYPKILASGFTAAICFVFFCRSDVLLAFVFVLLSLLQFCPSFLYEKWARTIYRQSAEDLESYSDWVNEGLQGVSTIKAYQLEDWFMERFGRYKKAVVASGDRENYTATVEDVVSALISSLLNYGSYLVLGTFALTGRVTVAALPFLLMLKEQFFEAVSVLVDAKVARARCGQAIRRMEETRKKEPTETIVNGKSEQGASPKTELVRVEKISKSFENKKIVKDVSFVISEGEHVILRGENGSGKTTLMRILLGLDRPDEGTVRGEGEGAAFSFQEEPRLHLTMRELVHELTQGDTIDPDALKRHLTGFHIEGLLDDSLEDCSVGQRKKFYLAVALARKSSLLVLDEPTNHLDQGSLDYLQNTLQAMDSSWLVCTHDERLTVIGKYSYEMKEGSLYECRGG